MFERDGAVHVEEGDFLPLLCHCASKCIQVLGCDVHGNDLTFGVRWAPEAFVQQAIKVGHPCNLFTGISPEVKEAVELLASCHPAQMVLDRKRKLHFWLQFAKQTDATDLEAKSGAAPERLAILRPKRIVLLRKMIEETGYPDVQLPSDILNGFALVGQLPDSTVLPRKFSPALLSVSDLKENAESARKALKWSTRSSGDSSSDVGLWEKTLQEVERGWLVGPLPWESLGPGDIVSRRFCVNQNGKIRPIDDYSQSQVNSTVFASETASVDGTDFICAMFCYLSQCLMDNGKQPTILARSLDLSSAYRQLTISEESKGFSFISVFSPVSGRAELFRQVALPFGSKAAVNAFIRCSRCIQWLAATILHIPLSCYFDDFVWPRPHHLPTTVKPRSQFF